MTGTESKKNINQLFNTIVEELRLFTEGQARQITELAVVSKAMSAEHNPDRVLAMMLMYARKLTKSFSLLPDFER